MDIYGPFRREALDKCAQLLRPWQYHPRKNLFSLRLNNNLSQMINLATFDIFYFASNLGFLKWPLTEAMKFVLFQKFKFEPIDVSLGFKLKMLSLN